MFSRCIQIYSKHLMMSAAQLVCCTSLCLECIWELPGWETSNLCCAGIQMQVPGQMEDGVKWDIDPATTILLLE